MNTEKLNLSRLWHYALRNGGYVSTAGSASKVARAKQAAWRWDLTVNGLLHVRLSSVPFPCTPQELLADCLHTYQGIYDVLVHGRKPPDNVRVPTENLIALLAYETADVRLDPVTVNYKCREADAEIAFMAGLDSLGTKLVHVRPDSPYLSGIKWWAEKSREVHKEMRKVRQAGVWSTRRYRDWESFTSAAPSLASIVEPYWHDFLVPADTSPPSDLNIDEADVIITETLAVPKDVVTKAVLLNVGD